MTPQNEGSNTRPISADSQVVEGPEVFDGLAARFGDEAPRVERTDGDYIVVPGRGGRRLNVGIMALAATRRDREGPLDRKPSGWDPIAVYAGAGGSASASRRSSSWWPSSTPAGSPIGSSGRPGLSASQGHQRCTKRSKPTMSGAWEQSPTSAKAGGHDPAECPLSARTCVLLQVLDWIEPQEPLWGKSE